MKFNLHCIFPHGLYLWKYDILSCIRVRQPQVTVLKFNLCNFFFFFLPYNVHYVCFLSESSTLLLQSKMGKKFRPFPMLPPAIPLITTTFTTRVDLFTKTLMLPPQWVQVLRNNAKIEKKSPLIGPSQMWEIFLELSTFCPLSFHQAITINSTILWLIFLPRSQY